MMHAGPLHAELFPPQRPSSLHTKVRRFLGQLHSSNPVVKHSRHDTLRHVL